MLKEHLLRHGLSFREHFANNWLLTKLALKAAFFTLGHAITPMISGMRASQLHNEIWMEGRRASLQDLRYRLANNLYQSRDEALAEYQSYSACFNEEPLMTEFLHVIEAHYDTRSET